MDTNITNTWTIEIKEDEVFARCTNESLYQAYMRTADNPKGDVTVMQDDDKMMFSVYFGNAISKLHILLARRMNSAYTYSSNKNSSESNAEESSNDGGKVVTFALCVHDNHDGGIKKTLLHHCYEYVVRLILEQWFKVDFGSELERLEINHCLHYRKHPVRRRIGPLF